MKKIDLPLWTDTLFAFAAAGAFFFCLLRFYIPSAWGAAAAAAGIGGAAALLVFRLLRARRRKKRGGEERRRAAEALAFHLAMRPPEETARLFARCLGGAGCRGEKTAEALPQGGAAAKSKADGSQTTAPAADTGSETASSAAASAESKAAPVPAAAAKSQTTDPAAAAKSRTTDPAADTGSETASSAAASAESGAGGGNEVRAGEARYFLLFRLEKVTADELRPAVVAAGRQKFALGGAFTAEAEKLAAAFGVELWDAEKVYALVQGAGAMPDPLFAPPSAPKRKLAFRLRRAAWRGYAFSGGFLLLFSLWAIFPIYYLVSGGLLLAAAVLVRLFGKAE